MNTRRALAVHTSAINRKRQSAANMAPRSKANLNFIPKPIDEDEWDKMTLADKWKTAWSSGFLALWIQPCMQMACISFFWFITISLVYTNICFIIPTCFINSTQETVYYMKVLWSYLLIQCSANWLCCYFYTSAWTDHRTAFIDNILENDRHLTLNGNKTAEDVLKERVERDNDNDSSGLPWSRCDKCSMEKPARAHHCVVCDQCVLKRDHHCWFIGKCIGFHNQRHFFVLTLYILISSILGFVFTVYYLHLTPINADNPSYLDYFVPYTAYESYRGRVLPRHLVMVVHVSTLIFTGLVALAFLIMHACAIAQGKTTHELTTNSQLRSTASLNRRIQSVFGTVWVSNLLLPAHIVFEQLDDGVTWKDVKTK